MLLEKYRPKPQLVTRTTLVDQPMFPVLDAHNHLGEAFGGGWDRKLVPLEDAPHYEDELEPEYPVELLEPLAFILARLVNGLATRLATRGLATDEIRLRLKLEDRTTHERTLRLPVPTLDTKALLKLLQLDLAAQMWPGAIGIALMSFTESIAALESLPGIGNKRAVRLFRKRPYCSMDDVRRALDEPRVAEEIGEFIDFE